jgi:hypothetical protein
MLAKRVLTTLLLISFLGGGIAACASAPAATPTPQPIVAAVTATPLPTAAPLAVSPTATSTRLVDPTPAPTSTATPTATPAATSTPAPTATAIPTLTVPPAPPTSAPATFDQLIAQLARLATPTATRKGVANPKVDETEYLRGVANDLIQLSAAIDKLSTTLAAYDQGKASESEVVVAFEETSSTVSTLYQREVARDFPPRLEPIDDAYVEALRAADKMFTAFLNALKTGDKKYLNEVSTQYTRFQYFVGEFQKQVKQLVR